MSKQLTSPHIVVKSRENISLKQAYKLVKKFRCSIRGTGEAIVKLNESRDRLTLVEKELKDLMDADQNIERVVVSKKRKRGRSHIESDKSKVSQVTTPITSKPEGKADKKTKKKKQNSE
jgi:hypothetical protein